VQIISLLRQGYGIAFVTTLPAFLITLWVRSGSDRTTFALYACAAFVSAFFGGWRSGALATGLASVFLICQYRLLPADDPLRNGVDFVPSLILFVLVGLLASYLSSECRRAIRTATRFQNTVGRLHDAVIVTNDQKRVLFLNGAARALTGWQNVDALEESVEKVLHLVDAEQRRPLPNPLSSAGSARSGSALLVSRYGTERPVEYWTQPLRDFENDTTELLLMFRDVGANRRAERELNQRLERERDEYEQALETLQSQHQSRVAALESTQRQLQEQLAQRQNTLEELRQKYAQQKADWKQAEEKLRQEQTELSAAMKLAQEQLAERQRAEERLRQELAERQRVAEDLRREHVQNQTNWKRIEEQLRQELAQRQHAEETLRQEHTQGLAEWKRGEEQLRQELAGLVQTKQFHEEELAKCREREQEQRHELQQAQADHHRSVEELSALHLRECRLREDEREQLGQQLCFLGSLLTNLGEGVCALDKDGTFTFLNPAAETMLGRTEDDLLGRGLIEVLPAADGEGTAITTADQGLLRPLAAQSTMRKESLFLRKSDGSVVPVACTITVIQEEGQREGAVLAFHDVTEWQQQVEELRRQVQDLTEARHETGSLWERMPDRFRSLFARMREAIQVLRQEVGHANGLREPVELLEMQVRRLTLLLDCLAHVPRIARSDWSLPQQPVALHTLINRAVETASVFVRIRRHHLTVALPLEPEWLWGDATLLELILAILLDNAVQYTAPGGEIQLKAERQRDEMVVRVKDNGAGIPAEAMSQLVELCTHGKRFHDRDDGPGIGLASLRSLVEWHGGTVNIFSEGPGKGSEFVVSLPAVPKHPVCRAESPLEERADWSVAGDSLHDSLHGLKV